MKSRNVFALAPWFKGIKGRLLFAAILPLVGFMILGGISYKSTKRIVDLLETSSKHIIPAFDNVGEMRQARNKYLYNIWAAINAENSEERGSHIKLAQEASTEFKTAEDLYSRSEKSPQENEIYGSVKEVLPVFDKNLEDVIVLVASGDSAKIAEAKALLNGPITKDGNEVRNWTRSLATTLRDLAENEVKEAEETERQVNNTLISITAVASFSILFVLLMIASKISKSVGDISAKITDANGNVLGAVQQLGQAGNNLAQSSTESAASLEETVAALEEMTSMVKMNSDNAKQAAALSATSREAAEHGESEIQSLISSMNKISQSSRKIEEIISVIDDIAFQTNLLALNAAVEAARAGEQGKGFAVVAEAVRSLAQRSAVAAKDITSLIKDSVSQIEEGSRIADQSGTVLSNITSSVKKVSDLNNEIAAASSEQTTGIQQISKAMNQLDQSSQSNAASAEQIAATTGDINSLTEHTQSLLKHLGEVIFGVSSAETTKAEETIRTDAEQPKKEIQKNKTFKKSNVIEFKASTKPKIAAAIIPFDEEDGRRKVGTTDGF